jgi:hypothetical protein
MMLTRRALLLAGLAVPLFAPLYSPLRAQGAKAPSAFDIAVLALKPGEWIWDGAVAPAGPMLLAVNLAVQRAYVYRNGVRVGASTISSGKARTPTPTGIFQILQKNRDHRSNLYNDAPMPFMQRLTWSGIALHAGNLPGYPASHGCIRLPYAFAEKLFAASKVGMTVIVHDEPVAPETVESDAILARFAPAGNGEIAAALADPLEDRAVFRWAPESAPQGPLTIILTTANKRLIVYRAGIEIGRARVTMPKGFQIGTRAAQFAGRAPDGTARWIYTAISTYQAREGQAVEKEALDAVTIPPSFIAALRPLVGEGTTLLATDGGLLSGSTGKALTVITND